MAWQAKSLELYHESRAGQNVSSLIAEVLQGLRDSHLFKKRGSSSAIGIVPIAIKTLAI